MRRLIFAAAALAMASPAIAADQFDLVCSAKRESERFRVDLARGEWCFGKCELVQKLSSVTSGMIVLAEHQPAFRGDHHSYNRINRVTGEWEWFFSGGQDISGNCQPAPFSGFPEGQRKF